MKKFAYLLFFDHDYIDYVLALMRSVAQPGTHLRPHLTVRYPVAQSLATSNADNVTRRYYASARDVDIELVGPGSFGDLGEGGKGQVVVYLECKSRLLEAYEYKPDFPFSVFHLTLYEGSDRVFATRLLKKLSTYSWGIEFDVGTGRNLALMQVGKGAKERQRWLVDENYLLQAAKEIDASYMAKLQTISERSMSGDRLTTIEQLCIALNELAPSRRRIVDKQKAPRTVQMTHLEPKEAAREDFMDKAGTPSIFDLSHMPLASFEGRSRQVRPYTTPPEVAYQAVAASLEVWQDDDTPVIFGSPKFGTGTIFPVLRQELERRGLARISRATVVGDDARSRDRALRRWTNDNLCIVGTDQFIELSQLSSHEGRWTIAISDLCGSNIRGSSRSSQLRDDCSFATMRPQLNREFNINIPPQAEDYLYRVLLAHRLLAPGAISTWLLPEGFLSTVSGMALRHYFCKHVELLRIHQFGKLSYGYASDAVGQVMVLARRARPDGSGHFQLTRGRDFSIPTELHMLDAKDLLEGIRRGGKGIRVASDGIA